MLNPKATELYKAMMSCGRYTSEDAVDSIHSMREEVALGADPEEVLNFEGFEPDYVFDLI